MTATPQTDFFSRSGAEALAERIREFWFHQGFVVETVIERCTQRSGESPYWAVRSNLLNGRPRK